MDLYESTVKIFVQEIMFGALALRDFIFKCCLLEYQSPTVPDKPHC